jgi:CheW-like domain
MQGYHRGMEEPGQRAGRRRQAGTSGGGGERRGVPSEAGLRRLIAAWASDVQPDAPADTEAQEAERPELDAAARMGSGEAGTDGRMVVLATSSGACAASVDATGDIVEIARERLSPPPTGASASPYVAALVELAGELVAVLDPDRLCQG